MWQAGYAGMIGNSVSHFDPEVLPAEKWAVFLRHPFYEKITGPLDHAFYSTFSFTSLSENLSSKHHLSVAKLERINTLALQGYLSSLPVHHRAFTVKMLHRWIPTNCSLCRKGRESSPLCPRCFMEVETGEHVY